MPWGEMTQARCCLEPVQGGAGGRKVEGVPGLGDEGVSLCCRIWLAMMSLIGGQPSTRQDGNPGSPSVSPSPPGAPDPSWAARTGSSTQRAPSPGPPQEWLHSHAACTPVLAGAPPLLEGQDPAARCPGDWSPETRS